MEVELAQTMLNKDKLELALFSVLFQVSLKILLEFRKYFHNKVLVIKSHYN